MDSRPGESARSPFHVRLGSCGSVTEVSGWLDEDHGCHLPSVTPAQDDQTVLKPDTCGITNHGKAIKNRRIICASAGHSPVASFCQKVQLRGATIDHTPLGLFKTSSNFTTTRLPSLERIDISP